MTDERESTILDVKGNAFQVQKHITTKRKIEREKEDREFVPVIIKRVDESRAHPDDILERAIGEGLQQLKRVRFSLFLSAFSAGIILGLGILVVVVTASGITWVPEPIHRRLIMALVYPLGFIICILSGTQLFTEQTATAFYPILDRREKPLRLINLWIIVLAGNYLGTLLATYLLALVEPVIQLKSGIDQIAHHLLDVDPLLLFVSSILAGALMAQAGWLVLATPPQTTQLLCIYIVTFIIGVGGLHHSIAGSAEVFLAHWLLPHQSIEKMSTFLILAPLGNLVGGTTLVAILNYAHIRRTQPSNPDPFEK